MSSMSQQSHWLAKNRMSCTWSEHVRETPFDGVASQVGLGRGGRTWVETLFIFILVWSICHPKPLDRTNQMYN